MASLAFLVTELQSLASETRRRHPEIREAAERSLAILKASPEQATTNITSDGPQSDELLKPIFMGCATKNAKVVGISLGSLQRLISLKAVPPRLIPQIISTMTDALSQGVDIQLRILQTLLSLITNFPAVHGALMGDALLLCFKLQESRIAVVSSTAAATLRQLVMFVVDKVIDEDQRDTVDVKLLSEVQLPDGTTKVLAPSARDAFAVLEDLCLLANSEKPHFLKLDFLPKTFALELIESVVTNYHELFRKHTELLLLLQLHLCPLLLKALSDRPSFPLILRCIRVVFILLKQFPSELCTEAEVFLAFLIKVISEDADGPTSGENIVRPPWMRVLALEILRGLCSDAELVRNVWDRYDAQPSGSKIFTPLITALKRLITEKPALLGVSSQMYGVGVPSHAGDGYGLDVGGVAGMVATAASATVSGVVGMMASGSGLSLQGSAMKLQCIDQLDKADSPPIPESYVYLLGVQCIVSVCEGFYSFAGPLYTSIVTQRPRSAGDAASRAPPSLDLSSLPQGDPSTRQLYIVRDMVESGWPALLAALSFIISTNLSDELFVDVLTSYQSMTNVSGILALATPRDAFFTSLAKFAIPTRVVSSLDTHGEPPTPRTTASFSENLGLSAPSQPPGLSERNMACLNVFLACALFLAGSLGGSWFGILETLQNADYVLTFKGINSPANRRNSYNPGASGTVPSRSGSLLTSAAQSGATAQTQGARHPLLSDLDPDAVLVAMQRLFDLSKNLEDQAFKNFVDALCRLSSEMVGMQSDSAGMTRVESESSDDLGSPTTLAPRDDPAHRRRVSGIHIPRTLRSGDFGINKLGNVALLNIHRLIYRSPDIAWNTTTKHLVSVILHHNAPHVIRVQAARVLDEILVIVPRNLTTAGDLQASVQRRVLDVLAQQVIPDHTANALNTGIIVELRRMGLETLHQILQASGHTLVVGWETIFEMLGSVCKPAAPFRSSSIDSISLLGAVSSPVPKARQISIGIGHPSERGYTALIKIAFQSLTLVCDSVSQLSPEHLRLCISTLGQFGRQADTNIALTAAESLLWSVSDSIQYKRKDIDKEPEYSVLWMFLLQEVLGLCADTRPEVRVGAIQTLFRAMQLYGATLSLETWEECMWKITFPLLDSITTEIRHYTNTAPAITSPTALSQTLTLTETSDAPQEQAWSESKILALQSIGSIMHEFLVVKIMRLDSFTNVWDVFVRHIQEAVLLDHRSVSTPAFRCLEKAVKASSTAGFDLKPRVSEASERVWTCCSHIGDTVLQKSTALSPVTRAEDSKSQQPFTQESLVAFVDIIQCIRDISRNLEGVEWPLDRLSRLVAILKGILTYPSSPDYRPDIDTLTPVQAVVLDTLARLDLSGHGSPSLVMRDLSEYITLPFLAAFELPALNAGGKSAPKRVTYIALSKTTMPRVVELYLQFKNDSPVYMDGTLEAVISAFSIPVKLKYDCPPPSKFGNDPPLWKTATNCFLQIVKECTPQMKSLGEDIPADRIEGILTRIIDVFRGGILADCSSAESFSLEEQDSEETFDRALLDALKNSVVPYLGDKRVPDSLVVQIGRILHQGSRLHRQHSPLEDTSGFIRPIPDAQKRNLVNGKSKHAPEGSSSWKSFNETEYNLGTTDPGSIVPRERFSYWCFDLLFLICSEHKEPSRQRLATLNLTSLLNRCRITLVGYIADESLRGNLPFSRVREEELLYVLRKLMELRLSLGSFWAAMSNDSSKSYIAAPAMKTSTEPSNIVSEAVQRSSVAHLFHFYPVLCKIASIPRKSPSTWTTMDGSSVKNEFGASRTGPDTSAVNEGITSTNGGVDYGCNNVVELDARELASECLRVIGQEMGVGW